MSNKRKSYKAIAITSRASRNSKAIRQGRGATLPKSQQRELARIASLA